MLKTANDFLINEKKYNKGDKVVVVAGTPPNVEAATNLIRVHETVSYTHLTLPTTPYV